MRVINTKLSEVKIIEPDVYYDERGFFFESFNQNSFEEAIGYPVKFVQDNHSSSKKGVIRGLHYQLQPHPQGKLVRVTRGDVFDVAVDIRRSSSNFGRWVSVHLSEENKKQLWIPAGFAHGFMTLSDSAEFLYKTTDYWNKDLERSIVWNDPFLSIEWPTSIEARLSEKDANAPTLNKADTYE